MLTRNPHTIDSALQELKDGNKRFVDNRPLHCHQDKALLDHLSAHGQTPLAAILGCSDSRVPLELLFDQGFGDLFVVRVAGNILGEDETASLEYAVDRLGVPLVVVLGHTKCGAVSAAVQGATAPGALGHLLERLKSVTQSVAGLPEAQKEAAAIRKNVELSVNLLTTHSPALAGAVREGRARIIGDVYQVEDRRVVFI
jgi:carbonic anhydrase